MPSEVPERRLREPRAQHAMKLCSRCFPQVDEAQQSRRQAQAKVF
jgi:hypothetical protein